MKVALKFTTLLALLALVVVGCMKEEISITSDATNDITFRQGPNVIPNQYIIVFNDDVDVAGDTYEARQNNMSARATEVLASLDLGASRVKRAYSSTIKGAVVSASASEAAALRNNPAVKYVEQDQTITVQGGPPNGGGGGGGGGGEETPWGITRVNGGANYTGSSKAYILDSGIDLDHPDLNVDEAAGFNAFTSGKDGRSLDDGDGHGTHCAGTVAAIGGNGIGVVGVAAGATVVPVKVLNSRGSGSYSGVIAGVDFVGANGNAGDVANMSLGGPISQALDDAVVAAASNGIIFCLAAGNESSNANNSSPARANGNNIYTVSAMSQGDNWASFSNFANPPVDYCEPGVSIKSTWKGGGYNTISGTSMATPHLAGLFLLGNITTDGTVNGDPDGNADPIGVN
ncbi:MAG: S8 family serine peptidase [Saprospiraceae bacterium]